MNTLHELVWWRNRLTVILSLMEAEQTCAPNGIRWTHSVPFCWRAAKICGYDCVYLLDTVPSSDSQSVSLTIYWVWIFFCTVISNWMFYCQSLHYDLNNVLLIHRNIFAKLFLKQHSDGLEHEKMFTNMNKDLSREIRQQNFWQNWHPCILFREVN